MNEQQPKQQVTVWTEERVRELIEPARKPFQQVVRRDESNLIWTREADFATQILIRDNRFQQVDPQLIVSAVKNLAFIGLTLNPNRKQATILARYSRRDKRMEASAMVMYQGFTYLATEAGVHGIKSEVVYKADTFIYGSDSKRGDFYEYLLNTEEERDTTANPFVGVFVAAKMPAGTLKLEWLPKKDIFKIRDMSDSYLDSETNKPRHNSPWVKWFDEMAKKGGIKRAAKRWEEMITDSEKWERFLHAIKIDNDTEGVIQPRPDDIEGEAQTAVPVVLLSKEQIEEIRKSLPAPAFARKICEAYGVGKLEEIPAAKYAEITERIKAARAAAEAIKARKEKAK